MATKPDSRQVRNRAALSKLGAPADTVQSTLNSSINTEFDSPLRMSATLPAANALLNFASSLLPAADGANKVPSPVNSLVFTGLVNPTINFQTQALSNAADFEITWPTPNNVGLFRRVGFTLVASGKIQAIFSLESVTQGALANPGTLFVSGGTPIGYVDLECTSVAGYFKTAGSATNIIENAEIYRFGSGAGGGAEGGAGVGDDLNSLKFLADFAESFADDDDINDAAGFTDISLLTSDKLFRLNYDADKTLTGIGTAMALSANVTQFTPKAGDILVFGLEAKKITSWTSFSNFVIESAFSTDPTAAACNISQAVHTVDLNNTTSDGSGLAVSSIFPGSFNTILLAYSDSTTLADTIFDNGVAPVIAATASSDNTNWTAPLERPIGVSTDNMIKSLPASGTNLYLRFFAQKTSGAGAVNLLDYKVFWHYSPSGTAGVDAVKAVARTDGAGTEINCSVASSTGKTRITTSFIFGSDIQVFLDGKKLPEFVDNTLTSDAHFVRISGNVIELDSDYSGLGLQVEVIIPVSTVDNTDTNSSSILELQSMSSKGFQSFVDESATIAAPFTTIINRKRIPDFANDLRARFGIDRISTQHAYELQDELGPNGEKVYAILNDDRGLIRAVGTFGNAVDSFGSRFGSGSLSDYVEVTFYGTGLNILTASNVSDIRVAVDGNPAGGNVLATMSGILSGRNTNMNIVFALTGGLPVGVHTVRLTSASAGIGSIYGFEILNESAAGLVRVNPGTAFVDGKKLVLSSQSSIAYNTGFDSITREGAVVGSLGARGARALEYLKSDGTRGKAAYAVNSATATAGLADHTYEELIRTHHIREFGAGRGDDFSQAFVNNPYAFTLEDGTTTLVGSNVNVSVAENALSLNTNGAFWTLTFVGTGLDLLLRDSANGGADTYNFQINGGATIPWPYASGSTVTRTVKLASGLPYGTHTLRVNRVAAVTYGPLVLAFKIYQPKKPSLPSGAIELADYNVMADFAGIVSAGLQQISSGVLRKFSTRETVYVGTWAVLTDFASNIGGFFLSTSTINSYFEETFFGTGFEYRAASGTGFSTAIEVRANGTLLTAANFPTAAFTTIGTGISYNSATALLDWNDASTTVGADFRVTGLPLGRYTVRFTTTTAQQMLNEAFDIITPVHSPISSSPADLQNTLPTGSCAIADLRKLSPVKSEDPKKAVASATGVFSSPTNASTIMIPMLDMSTVIQIKKPGLLEICYSATVTNNGTNQTVAAIAVNGSIVSLERNFMPFGGGATGVLSDSIIVPVGAGTHKVDVYWRTSAGIASVVGTSRNMSVKEL